MAFEHSVRVALMKASTQVYKLVHAVNKRVSVIERDKR